MAILRSDDWRALLDQWIREDRVRERLAFQAELAEETRHRVGAPHVDLILACRDEYAPHFLPGFEVVYVDDADGDRITEEDRGRLEAAGLEFTADDAMPDVLLWNREHDSLWVIEAVTSDGEVDEPKASALRRFATRNGKSNIDFTTAYATWRDASRRQGKQKNIAMGTYVWIREDGSKHFLAETFPSGREASSS